MSQALAVVLLLNGLQISMPRPALLVQGSVWVPLRAVCERVGAVVTAGNLPGQVIVTGGRTRHVFGGSVHRGTEPAAPAMIYNGITYTSARELARRLHGRCSWNATTQALKLDIPWQGAVATPRVAEIAADPLAWVGQRVAISGQHLGCRPCPLFPTMAPAPPLADAMALADPTPLYHTASAPDLGPLIGLGRPVVVEGVVSLEPSGGTCLEGASIAPTREPAAGIRMEMDRLRVSPGDTLWVELTVELPDAAGTGPLTDEVQKALDGARFLSPGGREAARGLQRVTGGPVITTAEGPTGHSITASVPWSGPAGAGRVQKGVWTVEAIYGNRMSTKNMFEYTDKAGTVPEVP